MYENRSHQIVSRLQKKYHLKLKERLYISKFSLEIPLNCYTEF